MPSRLLWKGRSIPEEDNSTAFASGHANLMRKKAPTNMKRGPSPENLEIRCSWENAVKRSLLKKKPPEGWPKAQKED
jgi:hypothetical protein